MGTMVFAVLWILTLAAAVYLAVRKSAPTGVGEEEVARRLAELAAAKDAESARGREALQQSFLQLQHQQQETINATVERLRSDFSRLAAESLEAKAKSLSEKNAADVRPLFDGIRERFEELKKASAEAATANVRLGESLKSKLEEVGVKAQSLGKQAEDFVTALKGGNKVQGNWGEGILAEVLAAAGLKEDVNFVQQAGAAGAGLPDVTVYDGAARKILIDSKVNITDFVAAVNAEKAGRKDEAEALFKAHAAGVRRQVDNLASKRYPEKLGDRDPSSDYAEVVIMMMPSDATYQAAVTTDPALPAYANARRIVLAAPQMLFGFLVLFKAGMDRLKAEKHQQEIVKATGLIVDRMDAALASLEAVGKALADAQAKYAEARGKLGDGTNPQNVLVPAREILRLAGTRAKALKSAAMQEA